ncbi:MAG: poly-gamma-glutamate system protein [candidate division WOR-3 bacterium]
MIRQRSGKVSRATLLLLCFMALLFSFVEGLSVRVRRSRDYELKLASARLAQQALSLLKQERDRLGLPIDSVNDPNGTGLIGLAYSAVNYGRSDISDALTSSNPDFAALFVELLKNAGVRRGDSVGISWDGTYPALNVNLLAAVTVLALRPVIVTAQTSSSWGANYPGFTWLDQERCLRKSGIWLYRSCLATLGGADDAGRGLSPEGRFLLAAAADSAGVELFIPESLCQGIERRLELFSGCRTVVVIGRSAVDFGGTETKVASRLYTSRPRSMAPEGLVPSLLCRGKRVVYGGDPSRMAADFRLPVAPVPIPEFGKSRLYVERRYSVILALCLASVLLGLLWFVVRYDVEEILFGVSSGEFEQGAV